MHFIQMTHENKDAEKMLSNSEIAFINEAYHYLENPGWMTKTTQILGEPIEKTMSLLPAKAQGLIVQASERALNAALKVALFSLEDPAEVKSQSNLDQSLKKSKLKETGHKIATALTGAAGGFFGLATLPLELPVTTTLILRSVAGIAKELGADLKDRSTQLECLYIFAMGSTKADSIAAGTQYYTTRVAFSSMTKEALVYLTTKSSQDLLELLTRGSAPLLAKILNIVAARFQIVVTEKIVAQTLPVAGALAGGTINVLFTHHFNLIAKYHFGLKKLEQTYGEETVRRIYGSIQDVPHPSSSDQRA